MFRRTKSGPAPSGAASDSSSAATATRGRPSPKGRPTPSRKEAEAARRAAAKKTYKRRDQTAAQRKERATSSREIREGMKRGEEKYLPARDRGPVRRFIRDFVDARFSVMELAVPLMVVTLVFGYSGNPRVMEIGNNILLGTVLLIVVDAVILNFRLRRELTRRFPDEQVKRPTLYAVMRALQLRFLRIPKPQAKIGQQLPEHYR